MATPPRTQERLETAVRAYLDNERNYTKGAEALGWDRMTFKRHIHEAEQKGMLEQDPAIAAGMESIGTGIIPSGMWVKTGKDENGVARSIYIRPQQSEADMLERIRQALEGMEPAEPVPAPEYTLDDLCTVYGIADAHMGLRAWHRETGTDYDTDIAAARIRDWVGQCVSASPASGTGIILDIGDLTHANDDTYQTPKSKHVLDVDTRMFRTLEIGIPTLASAIDMALTKHQDVHVVILPGNHDSTIYLSMLFSIAERYRDDPRVHVHKEPGEFFVYEFGKVMVASHHGDKAKADRLVHFFADQYAEIWGRTRHRFLFTGHMHHHRSQDIGGMKWEQLRAVADRDAYAVSHAYASRAQLSAITFHKERGEIQRVSVTAA